MLNKITRDFSKIKNKILLIITSVGGLGSLALLFKAELKTLAIYMLPILQEHYIVVIFTLLVALNFVLYLILRRHQSLDDFRAEERFKRFEEFSKEDGVRYGYVNFYPTLNVDPLTETASGFGIDVLKWIFSDYKLKAIKPPATWKSITQDLINGDYDIIATPLYELRERTKNVSFTTPLFYADIGVFVRREKAVALTGSVNKQLDFFELKQKLKEKSNELAAFYVPGELQEHFCKKYLKAGNLTKLSNEDFSIPKFLHFLEGNSEKRHDIFFCERWQAENYCDKENADFINIMNHGEILLPVSFAVRKSDDTLRKFINLKLLEMQDNSNDGTIDFLRRSLPAEINSSVNLSNWYFVGYNKNNPKPLTAEKKITNISDHPRK